MTLKSCHEKEKLTVVEPKLISNEDKHKLLLDFLSLFHMYKIKIVFNWFVKHKKHFTEFSEAQGELLKTKLEIGENRRIGDCL